MRKITLITIAVFMGMFIVAGYCYAGWEEGFEGSTQAPEGKAYTHVEKTSEKSAGLFQPLTDFIVKADTNNRVMAYSDAISTPDAITGSVKKYGGDDGDDGSDGDDNGSSGGDNGVPDELDNDNVLEAGTGTPRDADMTAAEAEMGEESAISIIEKDVASEKDVLSESTKDSGFEGTIEKIDVNSGTQLGVK